ncbi:MAG: hypothetical protein KC486_09540, partial [Myxococcales bacterium]|nr:hypothetical protein [Myxococcales bacterium]
MSAADRLIGELRGGATLDAEGEFSLDGAEARRKLRAFQVADPRAYLLFLVQAAHFRGATSVAITRSLTSATVVFAGAPLTREDVDDLYSAVFRGARDRRERSRQCLGLGVNAALSLGTSARARIQGGPAEDRFVAQLRGEDIDYQPSEPTSRAWTDVTIKGLPFALRFGEREVELLLRGAAVSPLEVTVNGEALNPAWVAGGFDGIAGLLLSGVVVRGAGGTVIAGFARADYPLDLAGGGGRRWPGCGCVDLIVGGVWLERLELKHLPEEMRLIAYCDALRTDLSLTKVVRDEALQALLRVVDVAAGRALRAAFDGPWSLRPPDLEQATRRFLLGWRGSLREAAVKDPQIAALAERVTWPRLDGGVRTGAELLREAGPIPYVHPIGDREPAIDLVPGLGAAVVVDDASAFELLRELAGGREHAVDFAVHLGDQRRYNLERWRARPYQPRTGATHGHIVAITGPEGDAGRGGEVGLSRRGGPSTVDIVVDDACIATLPLDLPLSGISASLCGDFTPRPSFDGVYVDRRFAAGVVALLGAVDRIVRRLLEAASVGGAWAGSAAYASERLGYLELLCHADVREGVLRAFGLDAELCAAAERGELGELPRLRADDLRHPLATYAAFPTVRDAQLSLQEIAALARSQGHIDVIAEGHLGLSERAQPRCLRIDRRRRAILAALFGEAALRDASGLPEWVREGGRIPRRAADPLAGAELRI